MPPLPLPTPGQRLSPPDLCVELHAKSLLADHRLSLSTFLVFTFLACHSERKNGTDMDAMTASSWSLGVILPCLVGRQGEINYHLKFPVPSCVGLVGPLGTEVAPCQLLAQ